MPASRGSTPDAFYSKLLMQTPRLFAYKYAGGGLRSVPVLACVALLSLLLPARAADEASSENTTNPKTTTTQSQSQPAVSDEDFGVVEGHVYAMDTGDALAEVSVVLNWQEVLDEEMADETLRKRVAKTDREGVYIFENIPAGTYSIDYALAGYEYSTQRDVKVVAGKTAEANYVLPTKAAETASDIFDMEAFEVTASTSSNDVNFLENLKRESAGSIDFLSSEDFAKFGGTDVGDIIQRLPGVTVVEGQFAVVRGLGDRYNSTLLNGLPVPSPDPVRQGLQLDLFPTSIISSVVTNKDFLPNMPSNSSGAAFELNTKVPTDETVVWFKGGFRFNTNAMDSFLESPNAGFDDLLADGASSRPGPPNPNGTIAQVRAQSNNQVVPSMSVGPMGMTFSAGASGSTEINNRRLGFIFSATYDSSYNTQFGYQQDRYALPSQYFISPPGFGNPTFVNIPGSLYEGELSASALHYDVTQSEANVLIGILSGLTYDLDPEGDNVLKFTFLSSFSGTDFVQSKYNGYLPSQFNSFNSPSDQLRDRGWGVPFFGSAARNIIGRGGNDSLTLTEDTVSYEQRELYVYQLGGEHLFDEVDDLEATWGATIASTTSDTPNQSVATYLYNTGSAGGTPGYFFETPQNIGGTEPALTQTWRNIQEDTYGARADFNYNWDDPGSDWLSGAIKWGGFWNQATRDTQQVDSRLTSGATTTPGTKQDAIDALEGANSTAAEAYDSWADNSRRELAGYLTMSFNLTDNFNITGGARMGNLQLFSDGNASLTKFVSLQDVLDERALGSNPTNGITNGDLIGFTDASMPGDINRTYALPGVTLTYNVNEDWTIRAGYSQTLAQPSFRELSPYFSRELGTGDTVMGNTQLELSPVESMDVKVEYRFGNSGIASVSAFYKSIEKPIEQIVIYSQLAETSILTYFNNPNTAHVRGLEFEVATGLDFIAEELENFSVGANYSLINAKVGYPQSVLDSYFNFSGNTPSGYPNVEGPYVGGDGPPYGNNNIPTTRRLFDQPEWIINAYVSYTNPDWGTSVTLSYFSQSEVLTAVGSGADLSIDQYTGSYYELDLTINQNITDNLVFKFSVENITDTPRSIIYDPTQTNTTVTRQEYKLGQSFRFALEYTF